jgi:hypothetical protein
MELVSGKSGAGRFDCVLSTADIQCRVKILHLTMLNNLCWYLGVHLAGEFNFGS